MKKIIKITALVLAFAMLASFTDVPKKHWAYDEISSAQKLDLVHGISNELYAPDEIINRQELAVMLFNLYKICGENSSEITEEYLQSCVSESAISLSSSNTAQWSHQAVAYGLKNNFWALNDFKVPLEGVSGGTAAASRQMISRWLCDTAGFKTFGLRVLPFVDNADIDSAYYTYVDAMSKWDVMRGGEGLFYPNEGITRAEAAAVAVRVYNTKQNEKKQLNMNPFIYERGVVSSVSPKLSCFMLGEKMIQIDDKCSILLDGKLSSFDAIKDLDGKTLTASLCIGSGSDDDMYHVILQTKPVLQSGKVKKIEKVKVPSGSAACDYIAITIETEGCDFVFVRTQDTEVLSSVKEGHEVEFIADGIYLLEIE